MKDEPSELDCVLELAVDADVEEVVDAVLEEESVLC